jgi:hypothetical protein
MGDEIQIAARQCDTAALHSRGEQVKGIADLLDYLEQLDREESR